MRRRLYGALLAIVSLLVLSGCILGLTNRVALSPEQRYAEAVVAFNAIYETYLDEYDAAKPETQAEWKKRIDPLMADASNALRAWGLALKQGLSPSVKEELFLALKNAAWKALFDYGIVEVGG